MSEHDAYQPPKSGAEHHAPAHDANSHRNAPFDASEIEMEIVRGSNFEAVHVTPDVLRAVADWLVQKNSRPGFSWYGHAPVRFRVPDGELVAPMYSWLMRTHDGALRVLTPDEFDTIRSETGPA